MDALHGNHGSLLPDLRPPRSQIVDSRRGISFFRLTSRRDLAAVPERGEAGADIRGWRPGGCDRKFAAVRALLRVLSAVRLRRGENVDRVTNQAVSRPWNSAHACAEGRVQIELLGDLRSFDTE